MEALVAFSLAESSQISTLPTIIQDQGHYEHFEKSRNLASAVN